MTRARLTKILCPSCRGSGRSKRLGNWVCAWCVGTRRLTLQGDGTFTMPEWLAKDKGFV